ncbi:hypothetical protein [Urbifossiella limnaea]|uniref:PH domain-containing protein n=1 Tax=Urbifossiella limnaea TaxID=2528023 RepID=A0A517Y125_9BACT|nr:hypothetical protein [Urbifossiella limnaea]QDU23469.1 hypothetical protein ETAA1_54690 [Urbifossiella limnaea]
MLRGERAPTPVLDRLAEAALVVSVAFPLLLMGGGMILVGLLAVGPRRKDSPELWICLPAGLAILGVFVGIGYWQWWRLPRLTVTRFAFDGAEVVIEAPARGCVTRPVGALRSLTESRGRRGLLGWWVRFDGAGWVFLHGATPNAWQLVDQLRPHVEVAR